MLIIVLTIVAAACAAKAAWHAHLIVEGIKRMQRALPAAPAPPRGLCLYPLVYGAQRQPSRWQRARCVLWGHRWGRDGRDCRRCGRCRCLLFLEQANPSLAARLRQAKEQWGGTATSYYDVKWLP